MGKKVAALLVVLGLVAIPLGGYAQGPSHEPSLAMAPAPAGRYPAARVAAPSSQWGAPIRLQVGTFVPTQGEMLLVPDELRAGAASKGPGYYIVQFRGPILDEWKGRVTALGATLYDYIPDFAFLARMDSSVAEQVAAVEEVAWVGPYEPAYKISPRLAEAKGLATMTVLTFPGEDLGSLLRSVQGMGAQVEASAQSALQGEVRLRADAGLVSALARMPAVWWIEPYDDPHYTNDVARTVMNVNSAWTLPDPDIYGAGQKIAIFDTGIDTGNTGNIHADFRDGGTGCVAGATSRVQIISYPSNNPPWTNCTGRDQAAHGTHVAGSVAGNGACSGGGTPATYANSFAGIAPQASIVFQASDNDGDSGLECVPDLDTVLFPNAYDAGARIHTNSWGQSDHSYNASSRDVDNYTWQRKDFTILFAAGNPGTDGNRDGLVDDNLVQAPSTAKNCITVGASENNRPPASCTPGVPPGNSCGYTQDEWGYLSWEAGFDANPGHDDMISNDPAGMAGFSGHGPTADGRVKPDVVAPGTDIISVRSTQSSGIGWGVYNSYYLYMGGTSMATPLTAGAAVIVRDWLQDVEGLSSPSAALIKGLLINGATDIYPGQYSGNMVWSHTVPNSGDDFSYSNGAGTADLTNWGRSGCTSGASYYWGTTNADSHTASYSARSPNVASCEATLFMKNLVDLPAGSSPNLVFWHKFAANGDDGDVGRLEISADGGLTWTILQTYNTAGTKPADWTQATVSLAAYAGGSVKIRFRMTTDADATRNRWYVDDVRVDPTVARAEQPSARPNQVQGWGRVNLANSIAPSSPRTLRYWDAMHGLRTNESDQVTYASSNNGQQLRATALWTDYPGATVAAVQLVNDLDLRVTGPGGTYYPATARAEIAYDDNAFEEGWRTIGPGGGFAVRFTPSSYPATLTKVRLNINSNHAPFTLNVWSDAGGNPGAILHQRLVNPRGSGWTEFEVNPAVVINSGDFYVEMRFVSMAANVTYDHNNPYLGIDCTSPNGRSYYYDGSVWTRLPVAPICSGGDGDWGIRAVMAGVAVDRLNNVEGVDVSSPADGDHTIRVTAYNVPQDDPAADVDGQPYALITSGALGNPKAARSYHYVDAGNDNVEPFGKTDVTTDFSSGPGGYVTVAMTRTAPAEPPPSGKAFLRTQWDISSGMAGFSTQVVFHYDEADLPVGMPENQIDGAYRWSGLSWDYVGGTVDMNANTVTVNGVTAFSKWALGGPGPTAVRLLSFRAAPGPGGVLLTWETATEVDNLGFHLYRSLSRDTWGSRVNESLIPSEDPGQGQGATYAFLDATAAPGVTYYYTLVDVDYSGREGPHGPVMVALWRAYLPLLLR